MSGEADLGAWGVYVHVPFCPRRCTYCDFAVVVGKRPSDELAYVDALVREWQSRILPQGEPHAVYLGGGTPSKLSAPMVERILGAICQRTGGLGTEVTLEVNPETVDQERLQAFRQAGVTRLSIGAQALQDHHLRAMHRGHRAQDIGRTVDWAKSAGFASISLDAIYGWPGQRFDEWQATIQGLIRLEPDHLSLYQLQIEPHTALYRKVRSGEMLPVESDLVADMSDWAGDELSRFGYDRYEISSYAHPGHEGRMNRLYWTMNPYVGIGMAAHSFDGTRRWWNVPHFGEYIERTALHQDPRADGEALQRLDLMREYSWLGLRTVEGFSRDRFQRRFGEDALTVFRPVWEQLQRQGLVQWDAERIRLSARGLDLANQVMAALIDAEAHKSPETDHV